jgi:hypothetical protein
MIDSRWTQKDELIDILLDLKHDLGKYLFLHLSHLTVDSPPDMVKDALKTALFETRKVGGRVQTAREIWDRYRSEIDALDYAFSSYELLRAAIAEALEMRRFLDADDSAPAPHVGQIQKIARQVSETIQQIIGEESDE